jgi:hypothetical protein
MVEMRDFPAMWAISVPMAKAMGKPRMLSPGVTIQAPPIPKKPPIIPTPIPRITRPGQNTVTPEMGIKTYNQSIIYPPDVILKSKLF